MSFNAPIIIFADFTGTRSMAGFVRNLYNSLFSYETRLRLYKLRHSDEYRSLRSSVHTSKRGDFSLKPFDENECIFIHITKTAGTSVAKSLFGYLPYHYKTIDYRVIYGRQTFDAYYKFAFVRNPWDRVYSAYRYLKSGGWNEDDKAWAEENLAEFDGFDQFVKNWLNKDNIKKHIHFTPQYEFICDTKDRLMIDDLAYFETINEDFSRIAHRLNIKAEIGHHNANPADSYRNIYTKESKNIVADVYHKDILMFGYNFDGIEQRKTIFSNLRQ